MDPRPGPRFLNFAGPGLVQSGPRLGPGPNRSVRDQPVLFRRSLVGMELGLQTLKLSRLNSDKFQNFHF